MHLLEWNVCRGLTPSTVPIAGINVDPHTIYAKPDGALIWCRTLDSSSRAVLTPFTCELLESDLSPLVHGSVIKFTNAQPQHSAPLSNVLNNVHYPGPSPPVNSKESDRGRGRCKHVLRKRVLTTSALPSPSPDAGHNASDFILSYKIIQTSSVCPHRSRLMPAWYLSIIMNFSSSILAYNIICLR